MSLFDADEYGGYRKPRKPRTRHPETAIRLLPPWVLLRHHKQPPQAHLILERDWKVDADLRVLEQGGVEMAMPRCRPKKAFNVIRLDGAPAAMVCPKCLGIARKNLIGTEVIERG